MKSRYRLPKPFAQAWLTALRSGEYKQGTGTLVKFSGSGKPSYCCLGVAGALCGYDNDCMAGFGSFGCDGESRLHPTRVSDLKLPEELYPDHSDSLVGSLIELNDSMEKTFSAIADWIEDSVEFY